MLRQVVINNQSVHAVIHEPLTHRRTGKRCEILVGRRVGGRRGDNRRVGHRSLFFENGERAGDVGILLTDRDVNTI